MKNYQRPNIPEFLRHGEVMLILYAKILTRTWPRDTTVTGHVAWHPFLRLLSRAAPIATTCRCRKNCRQWKRSCHWKLRYHCLNILRRHPIAVVIQDRAYLPLWSSLRDPFENRTPVDEIFRCSIFKWVQVIDLKIGHQVSRSSDDHHSTNQSIKPLHHSLYQFLDFQLNLQFMLFRYQRRINVVTMVKYEYDA